MVKRIFRSSLGNTWEINAWGGANRVSDTDPSLPRDPQSGKRRHEDTGIEPKDPDSKRLRGSQPEEPKMGDAPMDAEPAVESAAMMMSSGSGGSSIGPKETPVIWHNPSFGFTETHTTVIPTTFWLSANVLGSASTSLNKIEVRLNSPYLPLITPAAPVAQTAGAARVIGISTDIAPDAASSDSPLRFFPSTYTTSHKPAWLAYWEKMYEVYTLLETQYEITIKLANGSANQGAVVLWEEDQYGATSVGNVMPDASLDEMFHWRGVKKLIVGPHIDANSSVPNIVKIKGTWRPGMNHNNVVNDADKKTWSLVGAVPSPSYTEALHMRFFKAPLNYGSSPSIACNVQIEMKYIVQFKDLKSAIRYPSTAGTPVTFTVPTDILKIA